MNGIRLSSAPIPTNFDVLSIDINEMFSWIANSLNAVHANATDDDNHNADNHDDDDDNNVDGDKIMLVIVTLNILNTFHVTEHMPSSI